ncbi:MAG: CYTH domain-containing protein [Bacillus sp. (in: firmicutes)]
MKQEIEIEFKNLLTKDEFEQLKKHFSIKNEDFKHQVNYYFDTKEYSLKKHGAALRIREKNKQFVLTLKQPAAEGLLESHESLTEAAAQSMIANDEITPGSMTDLLQKDFSISPSELTCFGSLATSRAEIKYMGGLLVLDHSTYLNKEDFEIEYEVTDFQEGKMTFENLLKQLNISLRQTDNKIKRFYNEKFKK